MASSKTKRSVRKKAIRAQLSAKPGKSTQRAGGFDNRRFMQFADARGKVIDTVELLTAPDYHSISINFRDKTCLNFSVQTGFTVQPEYSDWKTGEQRILRKWPLIRSHTR